MAPDDERHDRLMNYLELNMLRIMRDASSFRAFWEALAIGFMNEEFKLLDEELARAGLTVEITKQALREIVDMLEEVTRERDLYRAQAIKDL